jgi:hypothetical protein
MPILAALPAIGSALSIGSSVAGMLGKGQSGGANGTYGGQAGTYMPQNLGQADNQYTGLIGSMMNPAQALPGQISTGSQPYVQNIMNNPYSGQSQDWASMLAGLGGGVSGMDMQGMQSLMGGAGNLYNQGNQAMGYAPGILNSAMGYGGQIMNTAFDPQNSLHDLSAMQNRDSTNAINSMNGVAGSPFGAGLAAQSSRDFENQWQNNQLQRQATGANAYNGLMGTGVNNYNGLMGIGSNLYGQAANAMTQGSNLGNDAINSLYSTGNMPYSNYLNQQNNVLGGLGNYASLTNSSMQPGQGLLTGLGNYMGLGNNASRTAQSGQGQGFTQGQTVGSNLGSSLGGLGSSLGSIFGGGSSGGMNALPGMSMNSQLPILSGPLNSGIASMPSFG